jgi:hypothetical protein
MYAVTSGPSSTPHFNSPFPRLSNLTFSSPSYPSLSSARLQQPMSQIFRRL